MKKMAVIIFIIFTSLLAGPYSNAKDDPACLGKGTIHFDFDKKSARRIEKIKFFGNFQWNSDAPDLCTNFTEVKLRLAVKDFPNYVFKEFNLGKVSGISSFEYTATPEDIFKGKVDIIFDPAQGVNNVIEQPQQIYAEAVNAATGNGIAGTTNNSTMLTVLPPPSNTTPVGLIKRSNTSEIKTCYDRFDRCKNEAGTLSYVCAETSKCTGQSGDPTGGNPAGNGGSTGGTGSGGGESGSDYKGIDLGFNITPPGGVPNDLPGFLDAITKIIFNISIPIAVILIIISGILMLTSRGNTAQVAMAKNYLKYTIIGLFVILIGRGFITLVLSIIGGS